jgi:hypothetical protein
MRHGSPCSVVTITVVGFFVTSSVPVFREAYTKLAWNGTNDINELQYLQVGGTSKNPVPTPLDLLPSRAPKKQYSTVKRSQFRGMSHAQKKLLAFYTYFTAKASNIRHFANFECFLATSQGAFCELRSKK